MFECICMWRMLWSVCIHEAVQELLQPSAGVHYGDVWWCVWHNRRGRKLKEAGLWVINHWSLTHEHTRIYVYTHACSYEAWCWACSWNKPNMYTQIQWIYTVCECTAGLHATDFVGLPRQAPTLLLHSRGGVSSGRILHLIALPWTRCRCRHVSDGKSVNFDKS